MLNATQQVGASLGTAFLATLSVGAITNYVTDVVAKGGNPQDPAVGLQAQVEGYTTAFTWASALLRARRRGVGPAHPGHEGGPARRGGRARGLTDAHGLRRLFGESLPGGLPLHAEGLADAFPGEFPSARLGDPGPEVVVDLIADGLDARQVLEQCLVVDLVPDRDAWHRSAVAWWR